MFNITANEISETYVLQLMSCLVPRMCSFRGILHSLYSPVIVLLAGALISLRGTESNHCSDTEPGFVCLFACVPAGDGSSRTRRAMFPVSAVLAQPEGIQTLPGAEAPGTGIVRKGHAGRAQEERSVQRQGLRFVHPPHK